MNTNIYFTFVKYDDHNPGNDLRPNWWIQTGVFNGAVHVDVADGKEGLVLGLEGDLPADGWEC